MMAEITRRGWLVGVTLCAGLALGSVAAADTVTIGGTGWQPAQTPQENYSQYWDGDSWDTISTPNGGSYNPCSAGSLVQDITCAGISLSSTGSVPASPTGTNYWGLADGSPDLNFWFGDAFTGTYALTMTSEITALWDSNELGWYDVATGTRYSIFTPDMGVGDTVTTTLTGPFGFYYYNTLLGQTYFTQSALNTPSMYLMDGWNVTQQQQFVLFEENGTFWVGLEDLSGSTDGTGWFYSDYDFNDLVFSMTPVERVPEPASLLLVALGLGGVFLTRRRRT